MVARDVMWKDTPYQHLMVPVGPRLTISERLRTGPVSYQVLILVVSVALTACSRTAAEPQRPELQYPVTATVEHVDTYHGINVPDPYRWLEDDVRESEAVANWVEGENAVTFAYLDSIPARDLIKERLTELWDYDRYSLPVKEGGHYFFHHNGGLQNQSVIYVQTSLDAEAAVLIDPNTWSDDGTVALASYSPSPDGKHVAYMIQDGGSDWRKARVLEIDTGTVLEEELDWLKFTGLSWTRMVPGFITAVIRRPAKKKGSSH